MYAASPVTRAEVHPWKEEPPESFLPRDAQGEAAHWEAKSAQLELVRPVPLRDADHLVAAMRR